jgi:hypothetical protein
MLHIWVALGFIIILDQGVHPAHAQQFYYIGEMAICMALNTGGILSLEIRSEELEASVNLIKCSTISWKK